MFVLDSRKERLVILLLTVAMAATRIEHFGINRIAPDASTAIFFLAGLLIGNPLWLVAFLAEALALDVTAIQAVGVSSACITFGYCMMIPAYAALWYAPRALRTDFNPSLSGFAKLALACAAGLAAFFVFSNIGYYFGGGYSTSLGFAEYARRVSRYLPYYLEVTLLYSAVGVALAAAGAYFAGHRRFAAR
jgi:hypothetical protein